MILVTYCAIIIYNMKAPKRRTAVQKSSFQMRRHISIIELLDRFFFVFSGVATLWLGVLLFMEGWNVHWAYWVYFVVFWFVVAYLGLPRLHRILSYIYSPDYFIGRTRTTDGILGDPVNLAFRGSESQLHAAMKAAGWVCADEITAKSTWKMIISTLRRKSYLNAPVSTAFLFGRRQDFAYQQEVDGSPSQRQHGRFWHCPKGWFLPGGHKVDWLASGTYDKSIGLSLFTLQVTHKIDENTDIERDYIINSVLASNKKVGLKIIEDFSTGYHARNGGGDSFLTDGNLPIVELKNIKPKEDNDHPQRSGLILDNTHLVLTESELTPAAEIGDALWRKRPLQLVAGTIVMIAIVVMEVFQVFQEIMDYGQFGMLFASIVILIVSIEAALIFFVVRGSAMARLASMSVATFMILNQCIKFFIHHEPITFGNSLVSVSLHIGVLLALSSDEVRRFVYKSSKKGL